MKKTIKNHASGEVDLRPFEDYLERYNACKNFFFNHYWNKLDVVFKQGHRNVRNQYVKDLKLNSLPVNEHNLLSNVPARMWKLALEESFSNIKTTWTLFKKELRKVIKRNDNLTDDEKHYLMYVLKVDEVLNNVLNERNEVIDKFEHLDLTSLNKYLNRIIRKNKFNKPCSKGRSYQLDAEMYTISQDEDGLYVKLPTLVKLKRINVKLSSKVKFKGNIRIVLKHGRLEVHSAVNAKVRKHLDYVNQVGIDKGYKTLLSVNTENQYGLGFDELIRKKSDYLNDKNSKRHKLKKMAENHRKSGNDKKADAIIKNNLGVKKINEYKRKTQEEVKSFVNHSVNEFLKNEKPKEVACEDLSWKKKSKGKRRKKTNRWLASWQKGYRNCQENPVCLHRG